MLFVSIRVHSWFYYYPFRVHSWFPLLNGRAAESPCGRAQARHPRTTLSLDGSPLQSVHALPSAFFSLLPTYIHISCGDGFDSVVGLQQHDSRVGVSHDGAGELSRWRIDSDDSICQGIVFSPFGQECRQAFGVLPSVIDFLELIAEDCQESFAGGLPSCLPP